MTYSISMEIKHLQQKGLHQHSERRHIVRCINIGIKSLPKSTSKRFKPKTEKSILSENVSVKKSKLKFLKLL